MDVLPCVEVSPRTKAKHAVIWLHGLGADGHDFEPVVPQLGLPPELGVRFVFPHAPAIPVSINAGMIMPAWYDITELDLRRRHDQAGIRRSADSVRALIARERERGLESRSIALAGFSQGGAIALYAALRHEEPLACAVLLSTYLVGGDELTADRSLENISLPIFQAHGSFDPMVPIDRGEAARDRLLQLGYSVEWHTYPMQHQVCLEEIRDIGAFLSRCFA